MLTFVPSALRATPARPAAQSRRAVSAPRPTTLFSRSVYLGSAVLVATAPKMFWNLWSSGSENPPPATAPVASAAPTASSLGQLAELKTIDGTPLDAATFAGKVVFAMNVASACGYTKPGYDLLKRLTDKYAPADFVAVAIPCNSFMWQENGTPEQVKTFALAKADKLVVTEKAEVNGDNPHPIVALAKAKFPGRIGWNFDGRFVFDRNGVPAAKFGNKSTAEEIEAAIDKCL